MSSPDGSEFDAVAADYEEVRDSYPAALVDAACGRARLAPGARVVEVGCGTGQLTKDLALRGLVVDAVDRGARLVERARARSDGHDVRFHVARFEDVALPEASYDAVFSATAFHWIDPAAGWTKAAGLLRPGGVLALLHPGLGAPATDLGEAISSAWREAAQARSGWRSRDPFDVWEGFEQRRDNVSAAWSWITRHELERPEAGGLFADVHLLAAPTPHAHTVESYLALMRTTSSYLRLGADARGQLEARLQEVFAQTGGVARFADWAVLVTALRR